MCMGERREYRNSRVVSEHQQEQGMFSLSLSLCTCTRKSNTQSYKLTGTHSSTKGALMFLKRGPYEKHVLNHI